jgi:hypothetical protein
MCWRGILRARVVAVAITSSRARLGRHSTKGKCVVGLAKGPGAELRANWVLVVRGVALTCRDVVRLLPRVATRKTSPLRLALFAVPQGKLGKMRACWAGIRLTLDAFACAHVTVACAPSDPIQSLTTCVSPASPTQYSPPDDAHLPTRGSSCQFTKGRRCSIHNDAIMCNPC